MGGCKMKSVFNKIEEKSVFNKIEEKSKELKFPILAEALVYGKTFVVLFLSNTKGIVVKGNSRNSIGEYDETFVDVAYKTNWRILSPEESVVLSND